MFNAKLIREMRKQRSLRLAKFAELLEISEAYLSMLEKGRRQPSLTFIQRLVDMTGIPVDRWLVISSSNDEAASSGKENVSAAMDIKNRLTRKHRELMKAVERNWELEQANEHLAAGIRLRNDYGEIIGADSLPKIEKLKKLEELASRTMKQGELNFDEILDVLKVNRSMLRNWLEVKKQAYKCRFVGSGEIMACSPGEAALSLCCFDCKELETGECLGHGNEKRPENIAELLDRLRANGVYGGAEQALILEKYYGLPLTAHDIANIRYRIKNGLPISDDLFYLDMR